MNRFEEVWRIKLQNNTKEATNSHIKEQIKSISDENPIDYTKKAIKKLKDEVIEEKIKAIFCQTACHIPHQKLTHIKQIYMDSNSLHLTHNALIQSFKKDIKEYKELSDSQVEDLIQKGWGMAGILKNDEIIATKIPSQFHKYMEETDEQRKKYYYCHCPRVNKEILAKSDIDPIYCYCGGGYYKDIWEYITENEISVTLLKSIFNGDDVCQFKITF